MHIPNDSLELSPRNNETSLVLYNDVPKGAVSTCGIVKKLHTLLLSLTIFILAAIATLFVTLSSPVNNALESNTRLAPLQIERISEEESRFREFDKLLVFYARHTISTELFVSKIDLATGTMALVAAPTGSSKQSDTMEHPAYSRLRKPVLRSRMPHPIPAYGRPDVIQPLDVPMNIGSITEYKGALKERYEDTHSRTEAAFDITREWIQSDGSTSNCRQAEGAYDYFTQSYNFGYKAHCEKCAAEVRAMRNKFESHYEKREPDYIDL
jgi:hypothetical protein